MFIADLLNYRVRCIDPQGFVHTFAGNGMAGDEGDGGLAVNATLRLPKAIAVDPVSGSVFIADSFYNRVRVVDSDGVIHSYVGQHNPNNCTGDGRPALTVSC